MKWFAYAPPGWNAGSLPGDGMPYGAWSVASSLNWAGTEFWNRWNVAGRLSWKVA